jgi:RNA 3'-terminal phosphate cyclase
MLGDGCCKTKASFIKRVLTPALNDINNYSDIRIKRRFHQPFGKGEQIWFSIRNINDDTPQENIKYHSKSTADLKKKHINDDNLMPIAVAMDDKMKKLIAEAEFSRPEKTKPRRFKGGVQSDK